jgi:hypothetical protein
VGHAPVIWKEGPCWGGGMVSLVYSPQWNAHAHRRQDMLFAQ